MFAAEDQALLDGWDSFFFFDAFFDARYLGFARDVLMGGFGEHVCSYSCLFFCGMFWVSLVGVRYLVFRLNIKLDFFAREGANSVEGSGEVSHCAPLLSSRISEVRGKVSGEGLGGDKLDIHGLGFNGKSPKGHRYLFLTKSLKGRRYPSLTKSQKGHRCLSLQTSSSFLVK